MDALEEVERYRQIHIEDAAEVLPHAGGQRQDETERQDRVDDDGAAAPPPDGSIGAHLRAIRPRHEQADRDTEAEDERQRLDEAEVAEELIAPRLRARPRLPDGT